PPAATPGPVAPATSPPGANPAPPPTGLPLPVAASERDPSPPTAATPPAATAAGDGDAIAAGWQQIVDALPFKVKAYYKEARPELDGSTLRLWFPYAFHHQSALESQREVEPRVKAWLGAETTLEFRLRGQSEASTAPRAPIAPEEDAAVQEAVRKLEGRVVRVREIKT
ncbi:MAG: hypothetical protein WAM30_10460, partial [Candidatus Dormiibacterota bacterium]